MKKLVLALIVCAIFAAIFFVIGKLNTPSVIQKELSPVIDISPKHYCYTRDQKATADAPYAVQEYIQIIIANDGSVAGTKTGTQSGPDMTNGYEGALYGKIKNNEIEVVYSYVIEGSHQKELEIYQIEAAALIKKRWQLVDSGDMLIPDKTQDFSLIRYELEVCI